MNEEIPEEHKKFFNDYASLCAMIGERVRKIKSLEKEIEDINSKADKLNEAFVAMKKHESEQKSAETVTSGPVS